MDLKSKTENVSIKEKFGRVFVRGKGGEYDILDGLRFSNTTLRIFDGDSEENAYNGLKYSFGILGQRLSVPINMGENILPNLKFVDEAYRREVETARQLRVINDDQEIEEYQNKCKLILDSRMSLFWMLCNPGCEILKQDFLLKIGPFLYIDDLLESIENDEGQNSMKSKRKIKLPYTFMCRMTQPLCDAIQAPENSNGKDVLQEMVKNPSAFFKNIINNDEDQANIIDELVEATNDNIGDLYDWVHFILGFLSYLRIEAIGSSKKNGCSPKAFLHHLADVMDAFCFEYSQEWYNLRTSPDDKDTTFLPTVVSLRQETGAALLFLESILLQNGINGSDDVRRCTLFKLMLERFKEHIQKFNDIISFSKEILGKGEEWRNNAACVLHKGTGMVRDEAFAILANEANKSLEQFERLSQLLLDVWRGTEEEENVINLVKCAINVIAGHMQWSVLNERYHKDIVMDCYIET